MITNQLDNLSLDDTYSLILFVLFKIKDIQEYSSLSELIYVLDENHFLRLVESFGGMTIRIPTLQELQILVQALTIYYRVDINKENINTVLNSLEEQNYLVKEIKSLYNKIKTVMGDYNFVSK